MQNSTIWWSARYNSQWSPIKRNLLNVRANSIITYMNWIVQYLAQSLRCAVFCIVLMQEIRFTAIWSKKRKWRQSVWKNMHAKMQSTSHSIIHSFAAIVVFRTRTVTSFRITKSAQNAIYTKDVWDACWRKLPWKNWRI